MANRQFKFRGWDGKRMMFRTLFDRNWYGTSKNDKDGCHTIRSAVPEDQSRLSIMQFSGREDKNGVEIYEGDVIKYANSIENGIGEVQAFFKDINLHCLWIEQHTSSPSMYTSMDYLGCSAELEVIGNIYQNPELLEAK